MELLLSQIFGNLKHNWQQFKLSFEYCLWKQPLLITQMASPNLPMLIKFFKLQN